MIPDSLIRPTTGEALFMAWLRRNARWQPLMLLALCVAVFWMNLSASGLHSTEGHRSIPGWEALDTGQWVPTRMFEASYVRKPPGMPWAVAVSSMIFGETEFAARAVSALASTLMALSAWWFARRWYGDPWGIAAGLAQALMPVFWSAGRAAEIEPMLCLGTQLSAFVLIDALTASGPLAARSRIVLSAGFGAALALALIAKAHAGLPVIAGVVAAACIVTRSARPLGSRVLWGGSLMAVGLLLPVAIEFWRAMRAEPTVTEDFAGYLWNWSRVGEWLEMPFKAISTGLPAILALLFPWGPDARSEVSSDEDRRCYAITRVVAIGFLAALAVYMLFGVRNERYAMPALVLLPPLAAYVARGTASFFTPTRRRFARRFALGSPLGLVVAMVMGAMVYVWIIDPMRDERSARSAADALARALPDNAEVWCNGIINSEPELLWYARREARAAGKAIRPIWKHREVAAFEVPPAGVFLLLNEREWEQYEASSPAAARLEEIARGVADRTPYVLLRGR